MTSHQNAVCDTCKMRKVKCDRDNPCGNCVDGNIKCIRTPPPMRQHRSTSKRRRVTEATSVARKASKQHGFHFSPSTSPHSPSRPQSPSILEAQDFIKQEITSGQGKHMPAYRLAVLKSAMSFVNHLSQVSTSSDSLAAPGTRVIDVLEGITYPSIELLYWMLRELTGNSIGPHVLDYFKHVSPKSLKTMGLALINRTGSAETLLLYSICVNSAAYKFVNTMLSEDSLGDVGEGMRACAATYLSSVKLAMARIQLLSAPSLLFLQSLLCSAFIAQGTGDLTHCWSFISAACKTCEDLGLENKVRASQTQTEDDEEVYYCFVWCHILDKSYTMMLGRSRCLLEYDGLESAFSSPLNNSMSSLLSTYLQFVPIQALFTSELHPAKILNNKAVGAKVEYVVQDLLERLERVHARIIELHGPSDSWSGLHIGSELNTIQFSYHSLRTSILRSRQICLPAQRYIDTECLESARMAMTTLIAIQEQSMTINDIRSHVAYMHWTVLYHPIMPFFVLFCNVVATSNRKDFKTLQLVTSQLDGLAGLSTSIAKLQTLFKSFIELCDGLVAKESPLSKDAELPHTTTHEYTFALQTPADIAASTSDITGTPNMQFPQQMTPEPLLTDTATSYPATSGSEAGMADPGWELFGIQPTLDWLDADYSFLDNNQWS